MVSPDERWMNNMERLLTSQGQKIDTMNETLGKIASQDEQLKNHQQRLNDYRDDLKSIKEKQEEMLTFQATCPGKKFNWVYLFLIPLAGTLIAISIKLLSTI